MILVISPKNIYAAKRLKAEALRLKELVEFLSVEDLAKQNFKVDVAKYQTLFIRSPYFKQSPRYIGEIIKLASEFKTAGKKVVDANIAEGFLGLGKGKDLQILNSQNIKIPNTTLFHGREKVWYPYILKWIYGLKARGTFLVKSEKDLEKVLKLYPTSELMLQEYIKADYEYKVITVGYKALPVVLRFKISDLGYKINYKSAEVLQLNVAQARGLPHAPSINLFAGQEGLALQKNIGPFCHPGIPMQRGISGIQMTKALHLKTSTIQKVVDLAEKSSRALGRELAKVDILQKADKFYVLEVNRYPGFKSFEQLTGYNVAGEFVKYLAG